MKSRRVVNITGSVVSSHPSLAEYFAGNASPSIFRSTRRARPSSAPLLAIPYGETSSYGQLARQLGNPNATRAFLLDLEARTLHLTAAARPSAT